MARKAIAVGAFALGTFGLGFTLGGLIFGRWRRLDGHRPGGSRRASPAPLPSRA